MVVATASSQEVIAVGPRNLMWGPCLVFWGAFESPVERGAVGELCVRHRTGHRDRHTQKEPTGGWHPPARGRRGRWPLPSQQLEDKRALALL